MQIKHVDGEIRLIQHVSAVQEPSGVPRSWIGLALTEQEAGQLLATDSQKALRLALEECKQHNAARKQQRIAELERQLGELKESL